MSARSATCWRRIDRARPLQASRDADRVAIAQGVQEALHAWCDAWGVPARQSLPQCTPATPSDHDAAWRLVASGPEGAAWLALTPAFERALAQALCGVDAVHSPLARKVVDACRDDLPARLLAGLRLTAAQGQLIEPARTAAPWSGQVAIDLEEDACLLLDGAAVATILRGSPASPAAAMPARPPLISIAGAMSGMRLPLQARLADCELDVGSLQDLRVGDIVPLRHRLDEPLQVRDAAGDLVFGGFLARQGQRKALELAAPVPGGAQRP